MALIFYNNAGITIDNLLLDYLKSIEKVDVNLTSTFLMCNFIKKMLKKYGKIINITSIVGHTEI